MDILSGKAGNAIFNHLNVSVMLEKTFGLFFYLKHAKNQKDGLRYVYLRITVDGTPKELATKRLWDPSRWDSKANRASGTKEDAKALNAYLDILQAKAYAARSRLIETEQIVTAVAIKEILSGVAQRKRMLLKIFEDHNKDIKSLIGKGYSEGTLERYETVYNFTKQFVKLKYGSDDINIHSVNLEFARSFYMWFRAVRNCSHNTSIKYISNLKKIIIICMDNGWLQYDPWAKFDMTKNEVDPVFLEKHELEAIINKEITIERLANVRDVYIFCCCTGLAFIDVKQLKRSEVKIGIDGELWIDKERQKTNVPSKVPLLPLAKFILERHKDNSDCIANDTLLPVLSNNKYNAYLKELADICGIKKNLTTHTARHTFGTTVTLLHGVPLETVKKMMGHKRIEQTEHYARVLPIKISSDMDELKGKLAKTNFLSAS